MSSRRLIRAWLLCGVLGWALWTARPCRAYIEAPHTLGRIVQESTNIVVLRVEKVDREKNLIIYSKVRDLKGKHPTDVVRHNIGTGGFNPREWQTIMAETEVGKLAVFFHNGSASETCINNYWYQCYPGGEWWRLIHGEPYLLRSYAGKPENLIPAVEAILAGQEVVVPCMVDGDKNALALRSAKIQRLRASLKLIDYDAARDFVGWGAQEFQRIENMPGFAQIGTIARVDPAVVGVVGADVEKDGRMWLCLYGHARVRVLRPAENTMEEVPLGYSGGASGSAWGDADGDGKMDLLLATPTGPKLLVNRKGQFADESGRLPRETYYNLTGAAFLDADADGRPDVLLANGFLGLRLYRNKGITPSTQPIAGTWFDDVSDRYGLGCRGIGSEGKITHLVVCDVNRDGRADFLYCNGRGMLVLNMPQGFLQVKDSGLAFEAGRACPVFADYDGDGFVDLFVPLADGSRLYRNDGKGRFIDVTAQSGDLAGLGGNVTCAAWVDVGHDGRADLMVGYVRGPNRFFRNTGDGRFIDATAEMRLNQRIYNTRSMCAFDMNRDGVADLAMNNEGQDSVVLVGASRATQ